MTDRYCLTLNLKDDPEAIRAYEEHHKRVWPEVLQAIRSSGIVDLEIYRLGTRLCMIMETVPGFSFEKKAEEDNDNPKVEEWERLMWQYQLPLKGAAIGEKWVLMQKIFSLSQ